MPSQQCEHAGTDQVITHWWLNKYSGCIVLAPDNRPTRLQLMSSSCPGGSLTLQLSIFKPTNSESASAALHTRCRQADASGFNGPIELVHAAEVVSLAYKFLAGKPPRQNLPARCASTSMKAIQGFHGVSTYNSSFP